MRSVKGLGPPLKRPEVIPKLEVPPARWAGKKESEVRAADRDLAFWWRLNLEARAKTGRAYPTVKAAERAAA